MMNAHGNTNDVDELHKGIGTFEMTSEDLPSGWTKSTLINLAHLQRGFDLPVNDRVDGSYPVLASNGQIGWHNEFKVKGPGVVTGRSGSIGKVHFVEGDYWPLNTSLFVKNFHTNHPKYVYYFLQSMNLAQYHEGTGVPTLNRNVIHDLPILIPPLPEQQCIAALLEKVDHLRRLRRQSLKRLDDLVQATFLEMFGDPVTNPMGWPLSKLIELSKTIQIGPFGSILHESDYITGGFPLVNPVHIKNSKINYDLNLTVTQEKFDGLKRYHLQVGDIIMGRRGEMGRCAIVEDENLLCGTGSLFIRLDSDKADRLFILSLLTSKSMKAFIEMNTLGATMPNLNREIVDNLRILTPPLPLQEKFNSFLINLNKQKQASISALKQIDTLFHTLMHQAFSGELNWKKVEQTVTAGQLELPLEV